MQKTQKINLVPYDREDTRVFPMVFACVVLLIAFLPIIGFLLSLNELLTDYLLLSFFMIPLLIFTIMLGFFSYPRFTKKPIPGMIEYDFVGQKILIHHRNSKLFPPIIIRFDEISKITYTSFGSNRGFVSVIFNIRTVDNRCFSLQSLNFDNNGRHVKLIATLEVFKEQGGFETDLQSLPKHVLSWINKFQHEGKLPFLVERELLVMVMMFTIPLLLIYLYCSFYFQ